MLSILIPTYNYNTNLLVEELYKQAFRENILFEIIILDDCSTEDLKPASNFKNVDYLRNIVNQGRTLSRKILAEKAQYDTLLFLDADMLPTNDQFISNYINKIEKGMSVVFGGYTYRPEPPSPDKILRYKYGRHREEKPASKRSLNPYATIFSGNLLIQKQVFFENNYSQNQNLYGMDNVFCYNLYHNNVKIEHIDNPILHLGLENNDIFFKKCIESVKNRKELLANSESIENINSLLKHYKKLKQYKLDRIVSFFFKLGEPLLKKMILKKDPNLFCLDIYRLGYICFIK